MEITSVGDSVVVAYWWMLSPGGVVCGSDCEDDPRGDFVFRLFLSLTIVFKAAGLLFRA